MMTTTKYFHVNPVGSVCISKNKRSRRIRLQVKPDGLVYVSMPTLVPEQKALEFVKTKSEWILQQQQHIKTGLTIFEKDTCFKTKFHNLKIITVDHSKVSADIGKGIIQVNIPHHYDCKQLKFQEFIRRVIVQVMRQEAKIYLPARLNQLASAHGYKYKKIFIKNAKSRWGSCSSVNNINLNLHLMRLPDQLIDYVLLHELTHTVEKNHSKAFWQLLASTCPDAKKLDKELNKYQIDIY